MGFILRLFSIIFIAMKHFFIFTLCLLSFTQLFATHIVGGEVYYTYLGPGSSNGTSRYTITLRLFTQCGQSCGNGSTTACPPTSVVIGIFNNASPYNRVQNITMGLSSNDNINLTTPSPCLTNPPPVCYKVNTYSANVQLPNTAEGYRISYQNCCRAATLNVVSNSGSVNGVPGAAYEAILPGTNRLPSGNNSSAVVNLNDTALVCKESPLYLSFGAIDLDGDSLSYEFSAAYNGGSFLSALDANGPDNPLYAPVDYNGGYSGTSPLGPGAQISPTTGLISGISPVTPGQYVVNVIIREWRNGVNIAEHRKDFLLKVNNCIIPSAESLPADKTCDGFTRRFSNGGSNTNVQSWFWDFGVPSLTTDTSNVPNPTFTYSDTGTYKVTLIVNRGTPCTDSSVIQIKVYPGFFPALNINPPFCKGTPVQFTDQTSTRYGLVTDWHWDFGNTTATNDTSNMKNPVYTYANPGVYNVKLVVSNTYGCTDSSTTQLTIRDNPVLTVSPKDTAYCSLDSVTLRAVGTGNFSWTPATNMLNANTATPTVFPAAPTKYYVNLTSNGCVSRDSVQVTPVNNLTTSITASATTICEDDTITLTAVSNFTNNLTWQWRPSTSVISDTSKTTKAFPPVNTSYTLTTRWGRSCVATATRAITVTPLAIPEAGPPAAICLGQGTAQLQASGGIRYQWTPTTGLSNPNIANPIAAPAVTTTYKVAVGVAGCTGTKTDSVTVLVRALPEANLTDDTLICSIDTLKLLTNPAATYVWSPNYMISSLTAASPLVSPDVPTTYYTTLTDQFGCINQDSILVDVKLFVTIDAGRDTTICRTDTFHLRTVSDALSYQWTPSTYLDSDRAKNPVATPLDTFITYRVVGNIGKCQSRDSVRIRTVPYPVPSINPDQRICYGTTATLSASGGSIYNWTPATFLNNPRIAAPLSVSPTTDTRYTVAVSDTFGCPKAVTASTLVSVRPPVQASTGIGRDTSIVIGQSIRMNASGGDAYVWSPSQWISDITSPTATVTPENTITYKLMVTQLPENCIGYDSVKITVFLLPPSFYVPTAFSPNGDGNNDVLRPKALGMKSIRYFKVYNRLGQLVFETTQKDAGWDGTYKGNPQDPAAYVWMAQGETYQGELITRQGSAVLIR